MHATRTAHNNPRSLVSTVDRRAHGREAQESQTKTELQTNVFILQKTKLAVRRSGSMERAGGYGKR
jgi:hypothetical protein